ncbi:hypothetical protein GCM10020255_075190 [Rhodococcus baikonurensis]
MSAAPDDCEAVALWLLDVAAERFGTTKLAVGGMSAGATLVMTTLLRLRDRGLAMSFSGAVLEAGTYDVSAQTPAAAPSATNTSSKPTSAMSVIALSRIFLRPSET